MRLLHYLTIIFILIPLSSPKAAQLLIEPTVGYETIWHTDYTTPYKVTRNSIGVKLIYGVPFIALEGEYLKASDERTFGTTLVKNDTDKYKIGLRSSYYFKKVFGVYLRAGIEERKNVRTEDTAGTIVTSESSSTDPYAGTGIQIVYGKNIAITAGVTAVFREDNPIGRDIDMQYSGGITIQFGGKLK